LATPLATDGNLLGEWYCDSGSYMTENYPEWDGKMDASDGTWIWNLRACAERIMELYGLAAMQGESRLHWLDAAYDFLLMNFPRFSPIFFFFLT
jgi:hypothetical protein